jgi:hypothetical protein
VLTRFAAIVALLLQVSIGTSHAQSGAATYTSESYGWSIDYPEGLSLQDQDPTFVRFESASPFALVGVHTACSSLIGRISETGGLADLLIADKRERITASGLTYSVLSNTSRTLSSGGEAYDIVSVLGPGGKARTLATIVENCLYLIEAETYELLWPLWESEFDRMIVSFAPPGSSVAIQDPLAPAPGDDIVISDDVVD